MRRALVRNLPIVMPIALLAVLYGRLAEPGTAFVERDILGLHLPMLMGLVDAASDGVPHWNPLVHGGQPLLANPQYAAFYPPTWLAILVPPVALIGWLVILHAALGLAGMWILARHLGCAPGPAAFAAAAFVGSSAYCSTSSMLNLFMGLSWMPWILLWGDRVMQEPDVRAGISNGAKLAIALAAQGLTGSPVTPVLSVLALGCLAIETVPRTWLRALRLIPAGLLGLALAAVQLLPTLRHVSASARASGLTGETATSWSTPPIRLFELLWPRLFGDPAAAIREEGLYFGYPGSERGLPLVLSLYCGSLVLALALSSLSRPAIPRRRALLAMAAVGLFLCLGRYNPLYERFLVDVPPFSIIRFPEKFVFLLAFALFLLAALSWQRLLHFDVAARRRSLRLGLGAAVVATLGTTFLYLTPIIAPELSIDLITGVSPEVVDWQGAAEDPTRLPDEVLRARAGLLGRETFASGVFWTMTLVLLLAHGSSRVSKGWLGVFVLSALAIDLVWFGWRFNEAVPAEMVLDPPQTLHRLPHATGRVFSDAILFRDRVLQVPDPASGERTDLLRSMQRLDPYTANLWGRAYALNPDPNLVLTAPARRALETFLNESRLRREGWSDRAYRLLGAWDIGVVVRRRSPAAQLEEWRRTGKPPAPARLLPNPQRLPRYRLPSTVAYTSGRDTALATLRSVQFRLADHDAVVEDSVEGTSKERRFVGRREILSVTEASRRVVIDYEAEAPSFLVAAMTYDRDWNARIEKQELQIVETAIGQIGIELPAGHHRLELVYRNPILRWGAFSSGLALAACLVVLRLKRSPSRA